MSNKKNVDLLVGAQWGDEGKGKVVDMLGSDVDVFVRFQGGANAGHTVISDGQKVVFHLLPSGMLYPGKLCVLGNGLVIDPEQFLAETSDLLSKGQDKARLAVSPHAHVVMPYHKMLDKFQEEARGKSRKIGTTGRGIGPCYVDKYSRSGLRIEDLLNPDVLREKLTYILEEKNQLFTKLYNQNPLPFDEVYEPAKKWGEAIAPYVDDTRALLRKAVDEGQHVLLEGAQAALLDIDHGTYPYVTSSSTSASGGFSGTGLAPNDLTRVIAVVKAYTTRVGEGPFPTEDFGDDGEKLRTKGGEFGATTGRPRRCGWLDMPALKYSMELNGANVIALTKLDVLTGMGGIKVCTAYEKDGQKISTWPNDTESLSEIKPVYETLPGWDEDITNCKTFAELPENAQSYVNYIEKTLNVPVVLIGVGADRNQTINRGM
ncbi:MAG: adenylosuccinate synthase [Synergistaceae bacterium]|nr:adenylosuccinate synthase [Synergistaceae bacterium]MBR0233284.1 adenylosuccinate synthase [Synergistaceae bacterium]MBR0316948.1 adenylosuccinate synthase [Synergistaceae bacterium]